MFVCTGNTCRSSMAQAIAAKMLQDKSLSDKFRVISAGTAAWPGSPASTEAVEVLAEQGIDLTQHRAQSLSAEIVGEADIVLTMTVNHRNHVLQLVPEAAQRTFTLKEYVLETGGQASETPADLNITDPIGQGREVYLACAAELQELIAQAMERLVNYPPPTEEGACN